MQSEFTNTLQSAYEQTINNPLALTATITRLDALKNTLQKNPEAVLSSSFLDCTLELSGDKSMPRKLREQPHPMAGSESVDFELSKREPGSEKQANF